MDKSLILIIVLCILGIFVATANTEILYDKINDIKISIQGENNQEPIVNIPNMQNNSNNSNSNNNSDSDGNSNSNSDNKSNNINIYNKNGIYFKYPNYWEYDQIKKLLSFYQKEYLSRWDDGIIFYVSNNSLRNELKLQKEDKGYKHPQKLTVDEKKAYSLSDTKADYWHYLVIVEKDSNNSYVFIFYCDKELKKEDKALFDQILKTMKLNN